MKNINDFCCCSCGKASHRVFCFLLRKSFKNKCVHGCAQNLGNSRSSIFLDEDFPAGPAKPARVIVQLGTDCTMASADCHWIDVANKESQIGFLLVWLKTSRVLCFCLGNFHKAFLSGRTLANAIAFLFSELGLWTTIGCLAYLMEASWLGPPS